MFCFAEYHWCFTKHFRLTEIENFQLFMMQMNTRFDNRVRYIIAQAEIAASGAIHVQGYIELYNKVTRRGLKMLMTGDGSDDMHLEGRRGEREEARDYCRKDDTKMPADHAWLQLDDGTALSAQTEAGQWEHERGNRTDAKGVADMVMQGHNNAEIMRTLPNEYLRMFRGVAAGRQALQGSGMRRPKFHSTILWGKTGTGKSHLALALAEKKATELKDSVYFRTMDQAWMDGYDGQKVVVLEEIGGGDKSDIPFKELLMLLCKLPYTMKVKGASRVCEAEHFFITSNLHPSDWYRDSGYNLDQLKHRCSEIHHVVRNAADKTDDWEDHVRDGWTGEQEDWASSDLLDFSLEIPSLRE